MQTYIFRPGKTINTIAIGILLLTAGPSGPGLPLKPSRPYNGKKQNIHGYVGFFFVIFIQWLSLGLKVS